MENLTTLLKGLLVGFIVGFPSGPVGLIYLKRATTNGFWAGFISGLGSTLAHLMYGFIFFFGLIITIEKNIFFKEYFGFICALSVFFIGYKTYKKTKKIKGEIQSQDSLANFFSSFLITTTNPMEVIQFAFLFTSLRLYDYSKIEILPISIGILFGSLFWPAISSLLLSKYSQKIDKNKTNQIHKIFGLVLLITGVSLFIKELIN